MCLYMHNTTSEESPICIVSGPALQIFSDRWTEQKTLLNSFFFFFNFPYSSKHNIYLQPDTVSSLCVHAAWEEHTRILFTLLKLV